MRRRGLTSLLLLTGAGAFAGAPPLVPQADPAAIVVSGDARFTVLTPRLVRMEWSAAGRGEDAASLVVVNRRLPVPAFRVEHRAGWLTITGDSLLLRYREGSGRFTPENLSVAFGVGGRLVTWHPGLRDTANLRGTIRTLDGVHGATSLEPGLLSRDGWTVLDDSDRPLFDESDWPWVVPRPPGERQDLYLFAHGRDYRAALQEFISIAGRIPLPPRFAFGVWWSRYWAYTQQEFRDLVLSFERHGIPLDVLVIDMDWHQTFNLRWSTDRRDQAGQRLGWTGTTWDRSFFPDPEFFLRWCGERGIRTPLNLHPASGMQPHEEAYPAMARAMGIDPATRRYVPFDIVDKRFAENYLNLVLRPLERQGVDFWWLDWQQWGTTKIPGVTPTWWLNYVHFTDMQRQGGARPLIFHRWGGLGNHRYQIGFSGDATSTWESLRFQPEFTATAANVGFGYWSHDIGGHMPGPVSGELYTRWVQFGAHSPVFRTHTTKHPEAERRIWAYPESYAEAMRAAVLDRLSLVPYLYSAARTAYDEGVAVCRPMYHDYAEESAAYSVPGQYLFGPDMVVAPVTDSIRDPAELTSVRVWLPPGDWWERSSGTMLKGPGVVERMFALEETPVFVRAGAVVPRQAPRQAGRLPVEEYVLEVVPGAGGRCSLYEDDGETDAYRSGEFARTPVTWGWSDDGRVLRLRIQPRTGRYRGMAEARSWEIRFPGLLPPARAVWNGMELRPAEGSATGWTYEGGELTLVVRTGRLDAGASGELDMHFSEEWGRQRARTDGVRGRLRRAPRAMAILNSAWPAEWSPGPLIRVAQTGYRIGVRPETARAELERLTGEWSGVRSAVGLLAIPPGLKDRALRHLFSEQPSESR